MSQAQKARLSTVERRKKDLFADAEWERKKALGEAKRMELDPKTNPSGQTKYGIEGSKYNVVSREVKNVFTPSKSASHAARLRGNKERGTQSSAARVPIK